DKIRNAHHVEPLRQGRPTLRIDLKDDGLPCHFLGHLLDFRRGHAARTTPFRPKVDQYRNAGTTDDLSKGGFIHIERYRQRGQFCVAGAAVSAIRDVLRRNPILFTARRTFSDHDGIRSWPPTALSICNASESAMTVTLACRCKIEAGISA